MNDCLLTYRSVTGAQRAAKVLASAGISATLMRTPQAISAGGCGFCLRIRENRCAKAAEILRQEGLYFSRAYRMGAEPEEVVL